MTNLFSPSKEVQITQNQENTNYLIWCSCNIILHTALHYNCSSEFKTYMYIHVFTLVNCSLKKISGEKLMCWLKS